MHYAERDVFGDSMIVCEGTVHHRASNLEQQVRTAGRHRICCWAFKRWCSSHCTVLSVTAVRDRGEIEPVGGQRQGLGEPAYARSCRMFVPDGSASRRKASRSPAVRYLRIPSAVCSCMPACGAGEGAPARSPLQPPETDRVGHRTRASDTVLLSVTARVVSLAVWNTVLVCRSTNGGIG
jgi:hypothetical protein